MTIAYGEKPFEFSYKTELNDNNFCFFLDLPQESEDYIVRIGLYKDNHWINGTHNIEKNSYVAVLSESGTYKFCIGVKHKSSTLPNNKKHDFACYTEPLEFVYSDETDTENKKLLQKMQMMYAVGGSISNHLKEININLINLIGDDSLVKSMIIEIFYKNLIQYNKYFIFKKSILSLASTAYLLDSPEPLPLIFKNLLNENCFVSPFLICENNLQKRNNIISQIKTANKNAVIYSLSEIIDFEITNALFYRKVIDVKNKNPNTTVIIKNIISNKTLKNTCDIDKQNANKAILRIRTELRKNPAYVVPGLAKYRYSQEKQKNIVQGYNINKSHGVHKINDKQSDGVNVSSGFRITKNQPNKFDGTIYTFGHSITFGIGTDDEHTFQSSLQRILNDNNVPIKYKVENNANSSWIWYQRVFPLIETYDFSENDIIVIDNHPDLPLNIYAQKLNQNGILIFDSTEYLENNLQKKNEPIFIDGAHLNEYGYQLLAQCFYDFLLENKLFDSDKLNKITINNEQKNKIATPVTSEYSEELNSFIGTLRHLKPRIGSIVMNCNPFTFGHRYLIEQSAKKVDKLFIFVVQEDKSVFPFEDRIELVRKGTMDLTNVVVLPSGKFIISSLTFGDYFNKSEIQEQTIDPSADVELFGQHIAPALGITIRFAGAEPLDKVTDQYNQTMARILPRYGIEFAEIPRKEQGAGVISASRVRKLLQIKDWDGISELVPSTTLNYLKNNM